MRYVTLTHPLVRGDALRYR